MNLIELERYLRVNLLGPGPSSYIKRIYRAAVSQRLRNTGLENLTCFCCKALIISEQWTQIAFLLLCSATSYLNTRNEQYTI
jgi:hypothetical protein